jgi:hypothetical protein
MLAQLVVDLFHEQFVLAHLFSGIIPSAVVLANVFAEQLQQFVLVIEPAEFRHRPQIQSNFISTVTGVTAVKTKTLP